MRDYLWDYTIMNLYNLMVVDIDYRLLSGYWQGLCACGRMKELKLDHLGCLDSELL